MQGRVLYLGLLLSTLAGCGDENRAPTHFTPSSDKVGTSKNDPVIVPAPAVPGITAPEKHPPLPYGSAAVALEPGDTSSLHGSGRLLSLGRLTAVSVALEGGRVGIHYEGAIRLGGCERMGAAVAALNPVSADSLGRGSASSDVPVALDSLLARRHVVVYGKGGRPETCGELGAATAPGGARPLPAPPGSAPLRTVAAGAVPARAES